MSSPGKRIPVVVIPPNRGMSQAAIAKAFGVSRTAVYQIEQDALRKLRRALEDDPELAAAFELFCNEGFV